MTMAIGETAPDFEAQTTEGPIRFHEWLGGIHIDMTQPGSDRIAIHPAPVGDVAWARVSHDSVLGRIESHWVRDDARFVLNVTVPGDATVQLPDGAIHEVQAGTHRFETGRFQ